MKRTSTLALLSVILTMTTFAQHPDDAYWDDQYGFDKSDGQIKVIEIDGDDLYVGGRFSQIFGVTSSNIARWNRTTGRWSPLGKGLYGAGVLALAVDGDEIYVGGTFQLADGDTSYNIAVWNKRTEEWHGLGTGVSQWERRSTPPHRWGTVNAIAVSGDSVFVGGAIDTAGGNPASYVAIWNKRTRQWYPMGDGVDYDVYALATLGDDVYVGGSFERAGDISASSIARWNRTSGQWYSLGGGRELRVRSIIPKDGYIYTAGWDPAARYGPNGWEILGDGINSFVDRMVTDGTDFYAIGYFQTASGNTVNCITRWDGSKWGPLGKGFPCIGMVGPSFPAIAAANGEVYAGGTFTRAGDVDAYGIAMWDGSKWSALPSVGTPKNGIVGEIHAIGATEDQVFVGGDTLRTGTGIVGEGLLAQDRATNIWSAPGGGLHGPGVTVRAVAIDGNRVFVGGLFDSAGDRPAHNIALWNSATRQWYPLGDGVDSMVQAIAIDGDRVFVGGTFANADGTPASRVAVWNTEDARWSPLGAGLRFGSDDSLSSVSSMVVADGSLYVAGSFSRSGDMELRRGARWDIVTGSWSPLYAGIQGTVRSFASHIFDRTAIASLAVMGGDLFAVGDFQEIDGIPVGNLAAMDLATGVWRNPLEEDSLTPYSILLAVRGHELFLVGGTVFTETGDTIRELALWNNRKGTWERLGSSPPSPQYVEAIALVGNDLYIGGSFSRVGDKPSYGIAHWSKPISAVPDRSTGETGQLSSSSPNPFGSSTVIRFFLPEPTWTNLTIFTPDGRRIRTLVDSPLDAGEHAVRWDAGDLPSGVYFYRLSSGERRETRSIMLTR